MIEKCIVYGYGRIGRRIVDQLIDLGVKIEVIFDANNNKAGYYQGISIINPDECDLTSYTEIPVLIAIQNKPTVDMIKEQLTHKGFIKIYSYYMNIEELNDWCDNERHFVKNCAICGFREGCLRTIGKDDRGIIKSLAIITTNRCTLNCYSCTTCVPESRKCKKYFSISCDDVMRCMKVFSCCGFRIHELVVSGGEPLVNEDIVKMLIYLKSQENIKYIRLLTTGTVKIPRELIDIMDAKLTVVLDDYGEKIPKSLFKTKHDNLERLGDNKFYNILDNSVGTWYDLGDFSKRDKRIAINNNKSCWTRNCVCILPNGMLTICPRAGMAMLLGLIPSYPSECIALNDNTTTDDINRLLSIDYIHGCEYCSGSSNECIMEAGIQSGAKTLQ